MTPCGSGARREELPFPLSTEDGAATVARCEILQPRARRLLRTARSHGRHGCVHQTAAMDELVPLAERSPLR